MMKFSLSLALLSCMSNLTAVMIKVDIEPRVFDSDAAVQAAEKVDNDRNDIGNINLQSFDGDQNVIEGDIVVTPEEKMLSKIQNISRGGVCTMCNRWPRSNDGYYHVPYFFAGQYTAGEKNLMRWSMQYIERNTNIRFNLYQNEGHGLRISYDEPGCWSLLGMQDRVQPLNLTPFRDPSKGHCMFSKTIVHELLHALGLGHEHQRGDRNNYIDVLVENVDPSALDQIEVEEETEGGEITPYDFASLMHYRRTSFSKNGKPVFEPRNSFLQDIMDKTRAFLSTCDVHELNKMYPGLAKPPPCEPGKFLPFAEPTTQCLETLGPKTCAHLCFFDNGLHIDNGKLCQIVNGQKFPPTIPKVYGEALPLQLHHRIPEMPATTSADIGLEACEVELPYCESLRHKEAMRSDPNYETLTAVKCEHPCRTYCASHPDKSRCTRIITPDCIESRLRTKWIPCKCVGYSATKENLFSSDRCQIICLACLQRGLQDCMSTHFRKLCIKT